MWEPTIARLVSQFRCLTLDFPGHGRCAGLGAGRSLSEVAHLLQQLLAQVSSGPAYLVGHDVGAALAEFCAVHWPERVRGLVLINPICLSQPFRPLRRRLVGALSGLRESWPGPEERRAWREAIRRIDKTVLLLWEGAEPDRNLIELLPEASFYAHEEADPEWFATRLREFAFHASDFSAVRRSLSR